MQPKSDINSNDKLTSIHSHISSKFVYEINYTFIGYAHTVLIVSLVYIQEQSLFASIVVFRFLDRIPFI